ncbi:ArnT family glycosyltransferase [Bradyrhizobium glycinis]|uniref:ArnT family glycosyltransferase n=1 Tax=Bradyrhizobium glycinis TaxID=2751812 RepID=UPI0018D787EE|nr:glycosyltransferase family 39 protein [Bradyrhizobium glycinis]MBH5371737.1 glycosyltransferase family 39 protein [Bradyrhizobium glycinis]
MISVGLGRSADPPSAERLVACYETFVEKHKPVRILVAVWAILTIPLVFFRGYNSDEGLAVSIARTALEDGEWLVPHMFNVRWIERPTLLAWIIAAVSEPFGTVNQISSRTPIILFVLAGCVLIFLLLRKVSASAPAALFGALLFLACPLVIRSYSLITSDLPLAVLLFLAFFLWWEGQERGSVSFKRWIAIGVVLSLSALMKGPQPLAYFWFGIGLFVLMKRDWRQIPGLTLAAIIAAIPVSAWYAANFHAGDEGTWSTYMRLSNPSQNFFSPPVAFLKLLSETVPAALATAVFFAPRRISGKLVAPPRFTLALVCYSLTASIFVVFWPGGSTPRYFFPAVLPLCVFGGMAFDALRSTARPGLVAALLLVTLSPLVYALGYSAASPFFPTLFRKAQLQAAQMTELVHGSLGPIYRSGDTTGLNILPYVPGRIVGASLDEMMVAHGPAWMVTTIAESEKLLQARAGDLKSVMPLGDREELRLLRLDR